MKTITRSLAITITNKKNDLNDPFIFTTEELLEQREREKLEVEIDLLGKVSRTISYYFNELRKDRIKTLKNDKHYFDD